MKPIILHIICEGQTEEGFVKKVLAPHLQQYGVIAKASLVTTNKKLQTRGGMVSFEKLCNDIRITFKQYQYDEYAIHYVSTLIDFYALPSDFPQLPPAMGAASVYQKVETLQRLLAEHIGEDKFLPYLQLHEFEALVLCGHQYLAHEYDIKGLDKKLQTIVDAFENPELINQGRDTAPSKRILHLIEDEGKAKYNKPKMGLTVTQQVGIEGLRQQCPHFHAWVTQLEQLNTP